MSGGAGPAGAERRRSPLLSVIVCTYDRYEDLAAALVSIERQDLAAEAFELIVVDNGSDTLAREDFRAASAGGRARFLVEDRPGLSRARNIGVRHALGRYVAFMDDDAVADTGWARAIVERFAREPGIGVLGGPVSPLWPSARPAWLHDAMLGYLPCVDHGSSARALHPQEWLAGTNIAYRREPLLAAGGFDETLGRTGRNLLSNEEIALTDSLRRAGAVVFYEPAMRVRHRVRPERLSQRWMRERAAWQIVSNMLAFPDESPPDRAREIATIRAFLDASPSGARGPQHLFADLSRPDAALHQIAAVEALLRLLLGNAADWRTIVDVGDG